MKKGPNVIYLVSKHYRLHLAVRFVFLPPFSASLPVCSLLEINPDPLVWYQRKRNAAVRRRKIYAM